MCVDYTVYFEGGYSCEQENEGCFGELKYLDSLKDWSDAPGDADLVEVVFHMPDFDDRLSSSLFGRYISDYNVSIDGSWEGDAMISVFSFCRYVEGRTFPSYMEGMSLVRKVLYSELLYAAHSYSGNNKYPNVDGEETVFDMKRLAMADALATLIQIEDRGVLYKGYQEPMWSSGGYYRNTSSCAKGRSITGYWQAPSISGRYTYDDNKVLSFFEVMCSSFKTSGISDADFIKKVDELVTQSKIRALDTLRSKEFEEVIKGFMENPTYDNLPEDARAANICLLYENLQRPTR